MLLQIEYAQSGNEEKSHHQTADFFETLPQGATGLIIMNPPYGERLDVENPKDFYKKIGDKLKFDYPDFNAWIFCR